MEQQTMCLQKTLITFYGFEGEETHVHSDEIRVVFSTKVEGVIGVILANPGKNDPYHCFVMDNLSDSIEEKLGFIKFTNAAPADAGLDVFINKDYVFGVSKVNQRCAGARAEIEMKREKEGYDFDLTLFVQENRKKVNQKLGFDQIAPEVLAFLEEDIKSETLDYVR